MYDASPEEIWELWTTAAGIESWWPPDGFSADVSSIDVRPGGELVYSFTATDPATIEFMQQAGMPLTIESRKTFTEVSPPNRIAYRSIVDFVPGMEPYEELTVVDIEPEGDGTRVTMEMESMHDDEWTQRLVAGRTNELDNLAKVIERRR